MVSEAWPRPFIDKSRHEEAEVRLSRAGPLDKHVGATEYRSTQVQTLKKGAMESIAYKFFQNWLRVIFQWGGASLSSVPRDRTLMGWATNFEKKNFFGKSTNYF